MFCFRLIARTLIAATAFLAAPSSAAEKCDVSASLGPAAQAVYDPFATADTVLDVTVTAQNRGDSACQLSFYAAPLGGQLRLTDGAKGVVYRIDAPRGGNSGLPKSRGPFALRLAPNESGSVTIPLLVRALQIVPKGDYTGQIDVRGVTEDNEQVALAGGSVVLRIAVPARTEMSISGTAAAPFSSHSMAPASIDFGEAVTGATQHVFVNVWANGSVLVTLSSENHGVLVHQGDASLPPIAYTARFDGVPVPLAAAFSVRRTPPSTLAGASYPLSVTLGDVAGHFAGRYQDIITISVDQN